MVVKQYQNKQLLTQYCGSEEDEIVSPIDSFHHFTVLVLWVRHKVNWALPFKMCFAWTKYCFHSNLNSAAVDFKDALLSS